MKSGSPRGSLQKAITALWNLKLPFVFALLAYKGELEVLIGAGNPVESGVTMQDLVRGCLPGVYMDKVPTARMVAAMADWLLAEVGGDVPVHFTRFHPQYKLMNLPVTPVSTLERARDILMGKGMKFVYVGNVPGHPGESTYCPNCGKKQLE